MFSSWTLIWGSLRSTWFHSLVSTSLCQDLHPSPAEDPSNTVLSQFQNLPSKCLMPRTWWLLVIQGMAVTWLLLPCSVAVCPWKRLMNRCLMCKTRTALTLWNGSPTMWKLLFVTSHLVVSRCLPPLSATALRSRNFSSESVNSLLLCSGARPSCIGTQAREWTKWNLLRYC